MPARKKKAPPGKRGARGHFEGSRLELLESRCDEYSSLRGKSRQEFWNSLFTEWWARYPWRLADDQEPPSDDAERMKGLAYVGRDVVLKAEVEAKLRRRVKTWFSYRSHVQNSHKDGGAWAPLFQHFYQKSNSKPRCRSVIQQFMHEHPALVDEAFSARYGERVMEPVEKMNKRSEITKTLLSTTYQHLVAELERNAKQAHEKEVQSWRSVFQTAREADNIEEARDSLFSAVHPLLKLIGQYAGCYVTLLAANLDDEECQPYFSAVHHFPQDKGKRKNWTEFDEERFKDGVIRPFLEYIQWMEGSGGVEVKAIHSAVSETSSATSVPSSPSIPPASIPAYKSSKKRSLSFTEDTDDDDVDIDMDLSDNDSSGSSMKGDHTPAKRLRTASIATRSGRSTPTSMGSTPEPDSFGDLFTAEDGTKSDSGPTNTHVSITMNTNINTHNTTSRYRSSRTPANFVTATTASDAPPPTISPPTGTFIDKSNASQNPCSVDSDTRAVRASDTSTQQLSPRPGISSASAVPEFLMAKQDIYGYLLEVEDPEFRTLLKNYIAYELAGPTVPRTGSLPTTRRPKCIQWWISRARPLRLPPYDSFRDFTDGIIQWWIAMQPGWRTLQLGEVSRIEDDWDRLDQTGANGFLSIVILAHWWARIANERGDLLDERYSWFVEDASWVLSRLVHFVPEDY